MNPILEDSSESDFLEYNHENPAPAIIGSGTTWLSYTDLETDFNVINNDSETYNKVFLLKDSTLTSDSNLTASGITIDFSEYTLTTDDHFKISNDSGTNIIRNGKVIGNIDLTSGNGNVSLSNMNVTGNINNTTHAVNIGGGHYNNISGGTGKVTITDGYYKGSLSGSSYEISGGYYITESDLTYLKNGYITIGCNVISYEATYNYRVIEGYKVNFNTNGHGTSLLLKKFKKEIKS